MERSPEQLMTEYWIIKYRSKRVSFSPFTPPSWDVGEIMVEASDAAEAKKRVLSTTVGLEILQTTRWTWSDSGPQVNSQPTDE